MARLIQRRRNQTDSINPSDVTQFFQNIANAEIPSRVTELLRTTYLVALEKDTNDKTKLRPLGIPSAIRRITAIALLKQFTPLFARDLLPYNFAVGVHGGCDMVISTIRNGVEKYITIPQTLTIESAPTSDITPFDSWYFFVITGIYLPSEFRQFSGSM